MQLRRLEPHEIAYAREIFGEGIDYGAVRIARGSVLATFSATALGNRINLQSVHFAGDTLELNEAGMRVLIHELAHVWQYQHFGLRYIASSLAAQFWAWVRPARATPPMTGRKPSTFRGRIGTPSSRRNASATIMTHCGA